MAIYFDGFDDKMLSFYSESGRVGMLAYPVADKHVKECDSKSPNFMGFVRNVQGNRKSGRGKGGNQAPGPLGRRHHRHGRFYSLIQEVM